MATNGILSWASGASANVFSDQDYASQIASGGVFENGVVSGRASSKQANKTWRQAIAPASGLAQFLVDVLSVDVTDADSPATFSGRLQNASLLLGGVPQFNSNFSSAVSGYHKYAVVSDSNGKYWSSTSDNNTTTPGASNSLWQDFFTGYMRLSGNAQTSSAPTTFSNGLLTSLGVASWTVNNPMVLSVGDAYGQFMHLGGAAQICTAATTFVNGLSAAADQVSGNANQYSPPLVLQSNGLGRVVSFYANLGGTPQAATELYTGTTRISYSSLMSDGSIVTSKGAVAFLADVLRVSGAAQSSSAATTFTGGLTTTLGVSSWNTNNAQVLSVGDAYGAFLHTGGSAQSSSSPTSFTNGLMANTFGSVAGGSNGVILTSDVRAGNYGIYVNNIGIDGNATRTISGNTNVTGSWVFGTTPTIPLGISSTSTSNTNVLAVGDAFNSFVRLAGSAQTVSANTTFSAAVSFGITPTIPLGISSTSTSNTNVLAVGDAFNSFLRLGGASQVCSSPTTFTQNTLIAVDQASGAVSQFSPALNLQSNGLGRVALFYANLAGNPQLSTELYSGNTRISYSALLADGSLTTSKGIVAFTSNLTGFLTIPGATAPFIQIIQATYNVSDGSNGTLITLNTTYPNKCLYAFGNDVGSGDCAFGLTIVDAGHVRIWARLGANYATGGINLITIGY